MVTWSGKTSYVIDTFTTTAESTIHGAVKYIDTNDDTQEHIRRPSMENRDRNIGKVVQKWTVRFMDEEQKIF